jgi:hypothetical protein
MGVTGHSDGKCREPRRREDQKRWQMRPNCWRPGAGGGGPDNRPIGINNHLIFCHYYSISRFRICLLQAGLADR